MPTHLPHRPVASSKERRNEIQWLRAIAAMEVVVVHSDLVVKKFSESRILDIPAYQLFGGLGVELFFIVSGYIMCMRAPAFSGWRQFAVSRIERILPLYWIFTSLAIAVGVVNPAWRLGEFTLDPGTLARSYLTLPGWGFPILGVGWTLEYEMTFYVLVMLLIATGTAVGQRRVLVAFGLAVLGCIGSARGEASQGSALLYHLCSPYMLAFGVGWLYRAGETARPANRLRLAALMAALLALAALLGPGWGARLALRITVAAVLFGAVIAARRVFQAETPVNRFLWLVGDASYALYLSHWFILSGLGKLLGALALPPEYALPARIIGCVAPVPVAIVIFLYIEKPLARWFGSSARRPAPAASLS